MTMTYSILLLGMIATTASIGLAPLTTILLLCATCAATVAASGKITL